VYTDPGDIPRLQLVGQQKEGQPEDSQQPELLPLEQTDVRARLTGFVGEVEVRQTYQNPHTEPIEAIYIFPLPENSAVNYMRMEIGERVIEAEIRRREEARREYEQARRRGFTAALLEQERPNIFTQSVANIAPGESIDVVVRYVQDLTYDAGQYEFVFPMVVGPRFIPGQELAGGQSGSGTHRDTDQVTDASRITPPYVGRGQRTGHDISLSVIADATLSVSDIEVPTHEVLVENQRDTGLVHISLPERDSLPNRDFVLRYRVAEEQPKATLFLSNDGGPGFFTLAIHPPTVDVDQLVGRREIIFVVDVSGSMSGLPLSLCRMAMRQALRSLRPVDTFNIITFAGRTSQAFEQPRPANDSNVRVALQVVEGMRAGGGTYMANAIDAALSPGVQQGRHRYVFFLTDGHVGNESSIIAGARSFVETLEGRQQRARVFGFGVGSSVNRHLLDGLSTAGRGVAVYATSREDPARGVNQFFRFIDHAVLEEVSVDWADLGPQGVMPSELPDLFASHATILHGRYDRPPTGQLSIIGHANNDQLRVPVTVRTVQVDGEPTQVLGSLWARSKVRDLEERLRWGEPNVADEITDLGLQYRLVTRYTSFVAVDRSRRVGQGDPTRIVQPVEMPEGVDAEAAGARTVRSISRSSTTTLVGVNQPQPSPPRAAAYSSNNMRRATGAGGRPRWSRASRAGSVDLDSMLDGALGGGRSRSKAASTKRAGSATPQRLTRSMILRSIRRLRPRLLRCYERGLAREPGLQGRLVMRFHVASNGRVLEPTVTSATLNDQGVQQCVTRVLRSASFPRHRESRPMLVVFPFAFAPDPANPGQGVLR
jgi:Ca-activated chloride channel family protein